MAAGSMVTKLLTLDVTNTILRIRGSVGEQYAHVALRFGLKLDPDSVNSAFGSVYKKQITKYPNFGMHSNLTSKEWWRRVVKHVLAAQRPAIGSDVFELLFEEIYKVFATRQAWEVMPHVCDTLQTIRNIDDIKIGVISNNDQRLHDILDDVHLGHLFDFVLTSAEVGHAKPAPVIFLKALALSQCVPSEAVHVGDSYQLDYIAPRKIGIRAYLMESRSMAPEEVRLSGHALRAFNELLPLLLRRI